LWPKIYFFPEIWKKYPERDRKTLKVLENPGNPPKDEEKEPGQPVLAPKKIPFFPLRGEEFAPFGKR